MSNEIFQRIHRIHAAINRNEENDLEKLKATITPSVFVQDFRGNSCDEELCNDAHMLIYNIANLQDHLKKWARSNGCDAKQVDNVFANSPDLQIIKDLSNNDKHGYPPRDNGHSKKCPQLKNIKRRMEMQIQPQKGAVMTFRADGSPKILGNGTAKAITTGDVVDNDENLIGDLYTIAKKAVEAWEKILVDFGLER